MVGGGAKGNHSNKANSLLLDKNTAGISQSKPWECTGMHCLPNIVKALKEQIRTATTRNDEVINIKHHSTHKTLHLRIEVMGSASKNLLTGRPPLPALAGQQHSSAPGYLIH